MTPRTRRRMRVIVPLGAIAVVLLILFASRGRHTDSTVATLVVRPENLRHVVSAEGTLDAEKSTPVSVPTDVQGAVKIGWIVDDQTFVKKGDVLVRFDPTEFEEDLRQQTQARTKSENLIGKSDASTYAQKHGLQRDAAHAQRELEVARRFPREDAEIFSRYDQIESELDEGLATERKAYAEDVLGIRSSLARADRDLLDIERRKAELYVSRSQKSLNALVVTAPHDGIVILQRDWRGELPRVGATLWPGRPIAQIPELGGIKAEIYVLEADANGVTVGQKATVTIEAAPTLNYPAKVTRVDKVAKPRTRGVPVQYFGVTLTLDKAVPAVMKPGARVRASIEIANRSNVIVVPRQAIFDVKGERVVYVRRGATFRPMKVKIGESTTGRVVITSGLAKNDEIALTDPTRNEDGVKENQS